jgi:hypothetical protein
VSDPPEQALAKIRADIAGYEGLEGKPHPYLPRI